MESYSCNVNLMLDDSSQCANDSMEQGMRPLVMSTVEKQCLV